MVKLKSLRNHHILKLGVHGKSQLLPNKTNNSHKLLNTMCHKLLHRLFLNIHNNTN